MAQVRRVLVINPNMTEAVTQAYVAAAARVAPPHMRFDGVTGRFGAAIVTDAAENAVAARSALDLVDRHFRGHDAIILAISFDTALQAIRDRVDVPVIAITQAAVSAAQAGGRRIGAVSFGAASRPLYDALMADYAGDFVGHAVIEIASIADYLDPGAKDAAVITACKALIAQGAEAVVICGAAIVGMAERLRGEVDAALYDGTEAVAQCLAEIDPPPAPRV